MLTKTDRKWMKTLPNSVYFGWAGFKHRLMGYLGMDESEFMKWDVPEVWLKAFKQETRRRRI